jgi:hypothetical protein
VELEGQPLQSADTVAKTWKMGTDGNADFAGEEWFVPIFVTAI